jgi:hypothetical protein
MKEQLSEEKKEEIQFELAPEDPKQDENQEDQVAATTESVPAGSELKHTSKLVRIIIPTVSVLVALFLLITIKGYGGYATNAYYELCHLIGMDISTPTGTYSGDMDFGTFSGDGTFRFRTGETYTGQWEDSKMQGAGTLEYPESGTYSGDYVGAQRSGSGSFTWDNGDCYTGAWSNDEMDGDGVYTFADGSSLSGIFAANQFVSGQYTYQNEDAQYVIDYDEGGTVTAIAITFHDGTVLSGTYSDNIPSGSVTYPNGDTYEGTLTAPTRDGTYVWKSGDSYVGTWDGNSITGEGIYTFYNGSTLDGSFSEGVFVSGSVENVEEIDSTTTFTGDISKGHFSGTGTVTYSNGDCYTGAFADSLRNGEGTYTWSNGDQYEGHWIDDKMDSAGVYTFYNGNKLEGDFADNSFVSGTYTTETNSGTFVFTISDGEINHLKLTLPAGDVYDGDFSDGSITGTGTFTFSNGDKYTGAFADGMRSGSGTYTWADGSSYQGMWASDLMSGEGTYYYPSSSDGYAVKGNFSYGTPDGQCAYYTDSSTYYLTDWENGVCVKVYE